jgi:hypothetical protein
VNRARGEVLLAIDGAPRRLCVTLGALAELEAVFDVGSLAELGEHLAKLTASDLITVIAALSGVRTADLARAEIDPKEAAEAVAEAFRLAFDE